MKNLTVFFLTGVFIILTSSIAFSQVKSDTCFYQAPKTTCEQAQRNADAIVKYPIALQLLGQRSEMLRIRENELYHTKAGFEQEIKLVELDKKALTETYQREVRRKKRWRFATGVLAIVAGAFYLK